MHIKTNIEHNIIQIAVIAICPLLLVVNNLGQALFFAISTACCYAVSAIICKIFNKYFDRNLKIFVTAIVSTFVMTILSFLLKKHTIMGLEATEDIYYTVFATICLCLDTYFIDSKSETKLYMLKVLFDCVIFSIILGIFALLVEILGFGTVFTLKIIPNYAGNAFFSNIIFKLVLLGAICVVFDNIHRINQSKRYEKKIAFEKYVKKIRDEKFLQYDDLRKKKLLASKIEINRVTEEEFEAINQKIAENEKIVQEEDKEKTKEEQERNARNEEIKSKLSKRSQSVKPSKKDINKNSVEEKATDEKSSSKKSKKKAEKLKGSVKKAKVERVFTKDDKDDKK